MAKTSQDILESIQPALDGFSPKVKNDSNQLYRVEIRGKDRNAMREKIHQALDSLKEKYTLSDQFARYKTRGWVSSFPGTIVEADDRLFEVVYKPAAGGQSGGGAALTKLTESAQCVYCAVRQAKGRDIVASDVNKLSVDKAKRFYNVDEKIDNILTKMPEEWITSCVRGANKIVSELGTGYTFHRGSATVGQIEKSFKDLTKKEGVSINLNKWSPADIYAFKNFNPKCLNEEQSFRGLNQCMQERIQKGIAIGISLKKIEGRALLKKINFDNKQKNPQKFNKLEYSKTSMDGYIHFDSGVKIQFRSFGGKNLTGWQGEVKGKSANQGKISLGPINLLLKQHKLPQVPTDAAKQVREKKDPVKMVISAGFKKYGKSVSKTEIEKILKEAQDPFLYSKWQVTKLFDIISNITDKKKKDNICEDLLLYASSQSSISAPYYKLTD